jgi:predicted RNase H-like nuclease
VTRPDRMRVVGIDPAPVKGLAVFDGEDRRVPVAEAGAFFRELAAEDDVLVCWDAPLTGPPETALAEDERGGSPFYERPIERFFSRKHSAFCTPKGVSVQAYAGCPHWALSRHLLGLPRVGPWDRPLDALPFRLAGSETDRPERGRWVVEVHPAVAAWLWCRDGWAGDGWRYKTNRAVREALWTGLAGALPEHLGALGAPANDDQLDARVAWALGRAWLAGRPSVVLLGDLDRGTFLLPNVPDLEASFGAFTRPGA